MKKYDTLLSYFFFYNHLSKLTQSIAKLKETIINESSGTNV